jgi:serine/threonine protein kinase
MRNNLNRYLNQKGFHHQFKPIKKLGKGNFATVYQVIRLEDHQKFAVKAFSKANTYGT